jgi:hypothetical protein
MTLAEFLTTAPEDHQEALRLAKLHQEVTGQLVDATTVNGVLTDLKLISKVKTIAEDKTHSGHDMVRRGDI